MNILVVRYRFIGDTILTVPFLRNLRKHYPDAKIDMLVSPISGDLLETCPYIDNLIYFDTTRKHRYEHTDAPKKSFWHYVKLLKIQKYDKAYILKRSLSSAALCAFAGIKDRIGFDTEGRGFLLTKRVPYDKDNHEIESFLDVLKYDNIPINNNYLELWLKSEDIMVADEIFNKYTNENTKNIIIQATSGNPKKQWNQEYFAKVIEYLSNEKNVQIFHLGSKSDKEVYANIRNIIKTPLKFEPINLCGTLSIGESAALINRMDLVFGNDTGTFHVAGALNIPTLVIYGPMNYKKWKVWNEKSQALVPNISCYPCNLKTKCKNNYACLSEIKPDIAIKSINNILFDEVIL